MEWKFDSNSPIYIQIMNHIKKCIVSGEYKPGEQIPSVRELAVEAGVNPNTMQKALSELEREQILFSKRSAGRFVAEINKDLKGNISNDINLNFINEMHSLGYNEKEILDLVKESLKKEEKWVL